MPAKCIVQETVQFNGQFGCSMREIEGVQVSTDKGGSVRVFPQDQLEEPKLRTSQSVLENAKSALRITRLQMCSGTCAGCTNKEQYFA